MSTTFFCKKKLKNQKKKHVHNDLVGPLHDLSIVGTEDPLKRRRIGAVPHRLLVPPVLVQSLAIGTARAIPIAIIQLRPRQFAAIRAIRIRLAVSTKPPVEGVSLFAVKS